MNNFDKKQKMVLGIIIIIVVGFICYYVYAKDEKESTIVQNNLEIQDTEEEFILVHISGAVNKEGVVELKINSRISDAIEKARRIERRC